MARPVKPTKSTYQESLLHLGRLRTALTLDVKVDRELANVTIRDIEKVTENLLVLREQAEG